MHPKVKALRDKYLHYKKHGNHPAAEAVRLQLNRLVCREEPPSIYVGDDEYFRQEGAVTGNVEVKSLVLVARDAEE